MFSVTQTRGISSWPFIMQAIEHTRVYSSNTQLKLSLFSSRLFSSCPRLCRLNTIFHAKQGAHESSIQRTLKKKEQDTVKPALSDHPTVQEKVVVIDRWSLKQGSLNSGRFFEALLNGGERLCTHAYDQRDDKSRRPGANGGLVWWFPRKLTLWWLF